MRITVTVVPLLVAFMMGAQPTEAGSTHAVVATVSTFLDDHASEFLDHMKGHFDKSLGNLFTGNAFADQSVQRPGLAKLLKEESDRHWNHGIEALKKYLQRGGKTPAEPQPSRADNAVRAKSGQQSIPSPQEVIFKNKFTFHGNNSLSTVNKRRPDFTSTYLLQCEKLVKDSKSTVVLDNELHRMSMRRSGGNNGDFDADMGHYFEEKIEEEVALMRKFSNLYTSLEKMANLGLAQHIFDQALAD